MILEIFPTLVHFLQLVPIIIRACSSFWIVKKILTVQKEGNQEVRQQY